MVSPRFLHRSPSRSTRSTLAKLVALTAALVLALEARTVAQCVPSPTEGCWEYPTYDWRCQVIDPLTHVDEFSIAALIPTGIHRGKVLLLLQQGIPVITNEYIFDPASPLYLFKVSQPLPSSLFCAAVTWTPDGMLLAAGGDPDPALPIPENKKAYRFIPGALNYATQGSGTCQPGTIPGSPWRGVEDMTVSRFYPGVTTAPKELIVATTAVPPGPSIPGGSSIVLGGAPLTTSTAGDYGNEFWQLMPPGHAYAWSRTFYPDTGGTHTPVPSTPSGLAPELYYRKSYPGFPTLPQPNFDSYPRGFFLENIGIAPGGFPHNLFVAGDTDTIINNGPSITGTEGNSWILRLPYATSSNTVPELWRGQNAGSGALNGDRNYGGNVFMHMKAGSGSSDGKNRILAFGGAYDKTPPPSPTRNWVVNNRVQEYRTGTNPIGLQAGGTGEWIPKTVPIPPTNVGRYYNNPVVLPTGEILIIGGTETINPASGTQLLQHFKPEPQLFFPGNAGEDLLVTCRMMQPAPNSPDPSFPHPYPRLYHNWALLLPDGRVINGGGAQGESFEPDPRWSADVFSPPYLAYVDRPGIRLIGLIAQPSETEVFPFSTGSTTSQFEVTVQRNMAVGRSIDQIVLLRPAAITHNHDSDQRYIELGFQVLPPLPGQAPNHERLQVDAPADDLGPAGWYMLFVVEKNDMAPPATPPRGPSGSRFVRFI